MKIFGHYIPLPFLALACVDFVVVALAVYAAAYIRFSPSVFQVHIASGLVLSRALLVASVVSISVLSMGLYQSRFRARPLSVILRIVSSILGATTFLVVLFYAYPPTFFGRGVLFISLAFSFAGLLLVRAVFYRVVDMDLFRRRVLVLGAGEKASSIMGQLRRHSDRRGFQILGFVPVSGEPVRVDAGQVVSTGMALPEFIKQNKIDEVVVAVGDRRRDLPMSELLDCRLNGTEVVDVLGFFEREVGKIRLDLLLPSWLIFSEGFQSGASFGCMKRMFDIGIAMTILAVVWPLMLLTAVAVFLDGGCRGPVLYRQVRVGRDGRPFRIVKFRSMCPDAEKDGKAKWATSNDSRVTRVGAFMRKTRLD